MCVISLSENTLYSFHAITKASSCHCTSLALFDHSFFQHECDTPSSIVTWFFFVLVYFFVSVFLCTGVHAFDACFVSLLIHVFYLFSLKVSFWSDVCCSYA